MIRPEKLQMHAEADAPAPSADTCVAPGVVREVVYLGASTHSVVGLDAGATLTVAHQNTDRSIDAALERRHQRVALTWRRDHLVALTGSAPDPAAPPPEEET